MIFIDSDNAMGSHFGDVDDAFAIAAVLCSGAPVAGISAVAGNTSERQAFANNRALIALCGRGRLERRPYVGQPLRLSGLRVLALGPLTNIAAALRAGARPAEVIIITGFNLTKDKRAAIEVFHSDVPLTIFPLDVARRLSVTRADLAALEGPLGEYLRRGARRWLLRLRLLKGTGRFPIYDLAAALYALDPDGFTMETTVATMRGNTSIRFGIGTRVVTLCRALDRDALWARFRALLKSCRND